MAKSKQQARGSKRRNNLPIWDATFSIIRSDEEAKDLMARVEEVTLNRYRLEANKKRGGQSPDFQFTF